MIETKEISKKTLSDGMVRYGYYDSTGLFIFTLHRDEKDGPALIYPDGRQVWCINGKVHREDGPAVIYPDGRQVWCINGKVHREDGPAVIDMNVSHFFVNGFNVTREVEDWLEEINIIDYKYTTEEDKMALLFFMRSLI